MCRTVILVAVVAAALALSASSTEAAYGGPFFGFGYEWLRDADGDGIPNHLDDDWLPPEDGTGYKMMHGRYLPVSSSILFSAGKTGGTSTDQTRDRDRLHDGTDAIKDRTHLRLRDQSCK